MDQDPEGGLTRQCNARPSFLIMYCVPKEQRQHDNHYLKTTTAGTFHNVYKVDGDEPELLQHEVPEPEDAHEEGKPCLICQDTMVKTQSIKTRVTMFVSVSHPMSISPVIEHVAPALVVFHAASATVIECSALQEFGHEHKHIWKRKKEIRQNYQTLE